MKPTTIISSNEWNKSNKKTMKSIKTNESIKWHKAIEKMKTYIIQSARRKERLESKIQCLKSKGKQ